MCIVKAVTSLRIRYFPIIFHSKSIQITVLSSIWSIWMQKLEYEHMKNMTAKIKCKSFGEPSTKQQRYYSISKRQLKTLSAVHVHCPYNITSHPVKNIH